MNNRRMWRRLVIGVAILMLNFMVFTPLGSCAAADPVKIVLNGESLDFDVPPSIQNDLT